MKFKTFLFLVACGGGVWYYFHDKDDAPNVKDDKSVAVAKQEESPAKEKPSQEPMHAKTVSIDGAVQMLKRYGILDENASGKLVTSVGADIGREFKENPIRAISEEFLYHFMMYKDGVENLSEYPYIDKVFELYKRANTKQRELQAQESTKSRDDGEASGKGTEGQETQVRILRKLPVQCLEAFATAGVKISNYQECGENIFAVNPPDPKLLTFLYTQCAKTSPDQVNVADAKGRTPLMLAACYSTADVCRLLIQAGARVDEKDNNVTTALMAATWNKEHPDVCRVLLDAGASVHAKNKSGITPLMWAARHSTADVCRLLIRAGARVDEKDNYDTTALMAAAWNKEHPDVCGVLLDAGASVHAKNKGGTTPLMFAALNSTADVCRLLIQAGAKVDEKDNYDTTALMLATRNKEHPDVCGVLLDAGASVHARNKNGWSPLMYAADNSTADVCLLLIQAGADVNAKKDDDQTALSFAVFRGDDDKVDMLIKNHADVRVLVPLGGKRRVSLLDLAKTLNQALSNPLRKESLIKFMRKVHPGAKLNYQEVIKLLEAVPAAGTP